MLGGSELDPSVNKALDRWVFNLRVKKIKKFPTVRPIPEKQGRVRGNKNIFKVGLNKNTETNVKEKKIRQAHKLDRKPCASYLTLVSSSSTIERSGFFEKNDCVSLAPKR